MRVGRASSAAGAGRRALLSLRPFSRRAGVTEKRDPRKTFWHVSRISRKQYVRVPPLNAVRRFAHVLLERARRIVRTVLCSATTGHDPCRWRASTYERSGRSVAGSRAQRVRARSVVLRRWIDHLEDRASFWREKWRVEGPAIAMTTTGAKVPHPSPAPCVPLASSPSLHPHHSV